MRRARPRRAAAAAGGAARSRASGSALCRRCAAGAAADPDAARPSRSSRRRSTRSPSATTRSCASSSAPPTAIPTVALRFFNVYGPGQALSNPYTGVAAIFASRLLNGNAPVIFEDGEQSRDFIHVSDIVEGILLALESDDAVGTRINLGTGRPSTVHEIARGARARARRRDRARPAPASTEPATSGTAIADTTLAERAARLRGGASRSRTACATLVEWLGGPEAVDRVDQATSELADSRPRALRCRRARSRDHHRLDERGGVARGRASRPSSRTRRRDPLDVVVADNESTDGTRELVETSSRRRGSSSARTTASPTRTTAALMTTRRAVRPVPQPGHRDRRRHVRGARSRCSTRGPRSALVGVKQLTADGELFPTIRRFPNAFARCSARRSARSGCRSGRLVRRAGARHDLLRAGGRLRLDIGLVHARAARGARERRRSSTSGSSSTPRRPTSASGSSRRAGTIRHLPAMTIVHHFDKVGYNPRIEAQDAYARRQYMQKHFSPLGRAACGGAAVLGHALRSLPLGLDRERARSRSRASRAALRVLVRASPPPFGPPPPVAIVSRDDELARVEH